MSYCAQNPNSSCHYPNQGTILSTHTMDWCHYLLFDPLHSNQSVWCGSHYGHIFREAKLIWLRLSSIIFFGLIFMERLETPLVTCHAIVWRVWSHQGIKTVGPKTLIWEGRGPRPFLVAPMFEAQVWAVVRIGVTIFSQWETRMGDISPIRQRDNAALFSILGRGMGRGWQVMAQLETNYILIPNTSNSLWHLICQFVSHSYLCILLRVSWSVWFCLKKQHFLCSVDNFSLLHPLNYS